MEAVEQDRTRFSQPKRISLREFVLQYGVYIFLTFLLLIGLIVTPKLYEGQTFFIVLRQASQLGIVAIGQTLVLLVAGLDLSVTAVIVLTAVTIAQVAGTQDSLLAEAILIALVLGLIVGVG